jgi:hypothetical protein
VLNVTEGWDVGEVHEMSCVYHCDNCIIVELIKTNETATETPTIYIDVCGYAFNFTLEECDYYDERYYAPFIIWPIVGILLLTCLLFICFALNTVDDNYDKEKDT